MPSRLFGTLLLATATALAQPTPAPPLATTPDPGARATTRHRSGRDILVLNCGPIDRELQEFGTGPIGTAALDCVQQGRDREGARLFLLAGIDARFDADRQGDASAVDSAQVLTRLVAQVLAPVQMAALARATHDLMDSDESRRSLCATIRKIGPPTGQPTYLAPSPAAASAPGRNFDADREWATIVQAGLDCPA